MTKKEAHEIMLIEDNENDVELILRAFKKFNFDRKVLVLRDGAEAIDYFFKNTASSENDDETLPKVIFLDLKLPKVDGLEVLRKVKENERTRMIPVVVLTSSNQERDLMESYRLGVNSYIVKPVDFDKFMNAVLEAGFYWVHLNRFPY